MNWLDVVLVIVVLMSALVGFRKGLITAAFTGGGIVLGVILAAQLSDKVGDRLSEYLSSEQLVSVVSYAGIIVVTTLVASIAGRIVRKVTSLLFLGFADKLGGLAIGTAAGVVIVGAGILGMAELAYNFEAPEEGIVGKVVDDQERVVQAQGVLDQGLTGSGLVPIFIDVVNALPADAVGFVPTRFMEPLDLLEARIDGVSEQPVVQAPAS